MGKVMVSCRDWEPRGFWCTQCVAGHPENCIDKREAPTPAPIVNSGEPKKKAKLQDKMASLFAATVMGGLTLIALLGILLALKLLFRAIF